MTRQLLQPETRQTGSEESTHPATVDVSVHFDGLERSPELQTSIIDQAEALKRLAPEMLACEATVKCIDSHHERHERVVVQLQVRLPAAQLYVGQSTRAGNAHTSPPRAIAESFDAMRQRLRSYQRQRRGKARKMAVPASGNY